MRALLTGFVTAACLLATASWASEQGFNGSWEGEGSSLNKECPDFSFTVSVNESKVHGKAHQTGTDYRINGTLTKEGLFEGVVTYLWLDIAALRGEIGDDQGRGTWVALEGPHCDGEFTVRRE